MRRMILVIGSFGYHNNQLDGQTIKTRQVYRLLSDRYDGRVDWFCTMTLRKSLLAFPVFLFKLLQADTFVALYPADGGFHSLMPILYRIAKGLKKRMIYVAIGSSQIEFIETEVSQKKRRMLVGMCRGLDGFLSETREVEQGMNELCRAGNVGFFPNFRYFSDDIGFAVSDAKSPLRLVFMARIMFVKGYDYIFSFAEEVSRQNLDIIIDFYGQVDPAIAEDFEKGLERFPNVVSYKGALRPECILSVLQTYDAMLLPTRHKEGIPGSVVDAFIASLPVVVTDWRFAREVVEDGVNGFIVPFNDGQTQSEFNERILRWYHDRELLKRMKRAAYESRRQYSADYAWDCIKNYL